MKTALFVDFDNIHSGLRKLDARIAERFARQPMHWLQWLMDSVPLPEPAGETPARRRILGRRVYLNPQVFQNYRTGFSHAGFEISDCPPITYQGKTSTDIHMVLDMVDALQHPAHYDEFIIFSADADFTPVLRKLRRWDRRTTILAVGFPSAAYRASADLLIDPVIFIREALGFADFEDTAGDLPPSEHNDQEPEQPETPGIILVDTTETPAPSGSEEGFDCSEITEWLRSEATRSDHPLACARLAAQLRRRYSGISTDWCGHYSFRAFMDSLPLEPLVLDWSNAGGYLLNPERHAHSPQPASREQWGLDERTFATIRQIHEATDVPLLSPPEFQVLMQAIASDANSHAFQLNETAKRVRDQCRDNGHPISREEVNWVLRGLMLCGHEFGKGQDDVPTLSYRLVGNLINLCRRAHLSLPDGTPAMLHKWVSGQLGQGAEERSRSSMGSREETPASNEGGDDAAQAGQPADHASSLPATDDSTATDDTSAAAQAADDSFQPEQPQG